MKIFARIAFAAVAAMFLATAGPPAQASEKGNVSVVIDQTNLKRMDVAGTAAGLDMQIAHPLDLAAALEVGIPGHSVVGLIVSNASNDGGAIDTPAYRPIAYIPMGISDDSANLGPVGRDSPMTKAHDPADRVDRHVGNMQFLKCPNRNHDGTDRVDKNAGTAKMKYALV